MHRLCAETGEKHGDAAAQRGEQSGCEVEATDGASQQNSPHPPPDFER